MQEARDAPSNLAMASLSYFLVQRSPIVLPAKDLLNKWPTCTTWFWKIDFEIQFVNKSWSKITWKHSKKYELLGSGIILPFRATYTGESRLPFLATQNIIFVETLFLSLALSTSMTWHVNSFWPKLWDGAVLKVDWIS